MGERLLCKQEVIGSIPFTSTIGTSTIGTSTIGTSTIGTSTIGTSTIGVPAPGVRRLEKIARHRPGTTGRVLIEG